MIVCLIHCGQTGPGLIIKCGVLSLLLKCVQIKRHDSPCSSSVILEKILKKISIGVVRTGTSVTWNGLS